MNTSKLLFGTAHCVINPTSPMSLAGYFNIRMYTKIFDDLEARALVLKKNNACFLLVQFDLITVTEALYLKLREAIADLTEFNEENILFTATHTHTGPDYRLNGPGNGEEYMAFLAEKTSQIVREALAHLQEGELSTGLTEDSRFEFNRRYWMKNGKVQTNPGKLNPEIDRPEGEADYEIPVAAISKDGKLQVLLANLVNHTDTIGGTEVSADWAGFTRRELEKHMGPGGVMFPLIGCAGNINHFDTSTDLCQTQYAEARRIGLGYADSIAKIIPSLTPANNLIFRNFFRVVVAGPAEISEESLQEAKNLLELYKEIPDPSQSNVAITSEDLAKRAPVALKFFASNLVEMAKDHQMRRFRLVGLDLGPLMIASLPSEPFVEIGLEIRHKVFADKLCMVVSHGNGTGALHLGGGYIPNGWNYGRGGYETEPRSNPFEHNTAQLLVDAWRSAEE